jgi:hypothetical protein
MEQFLSPGQVPYIVLCHGDEQAEADRLTCGQKGPIRKGTVYNVRGLNGRGPRGSSRTGTWLLSWFCHERSSAGLEDTVRHLPGKWEICFVMGALWECSWCHQYYFPGALGWALDLPPIPRMPF